MTGAELIQWIQENQAEDMEIKAIDHFDDYEPLTTDRLRISHNNEIIIDE